MEKVDTVNAASCEGLAPPRPKKDFFSPTAIRPEIVLLLYQIYFKCIALDTRMIVEGTRGPFYTIGRFFS